MTMTYDEAITAWGAKQLTDYGYVVSPDDRILVEETTIYSGICETCEYQEAGYRVRNCNTGDVIDIAAGFVDVVRELFEISQSKG